MELDDLKGSWQQAGSSDKNNAELRKMTKVSGHPKLKRIRAKLLIETGLLTVFLLTYQDAFDGAEKPLWANIVLIVFGLLFILNDLAGYFLVMKRVKGATIVDSLVGLITILKKLSVFSVVSSVLFGLSLILFFSTGLVFDDNKYLILAGMVVTLLALSYGSYQRWKRQIRHFSELIHEFSG
ncbi:MAG: hypothetical protein HEP71_13295 [Roseivirga sp.]|nr:hypothetical protein [Roseivirga sp.]